MEAVSTAEAREQFAEIVNRAAYGHERVILTRRGKALVAVVPIEDVEFLEELEDRFDQEEARLSIAEAQKHGTIPWESIKRELGFD